MPIRDRVQKVVEQAQGYLKRTSPRKSFLVLSGIVVTLLIGISIGLGLANRVDTTSPTAQDSMTVQPVAQTAIDSIQAVVTETTSTERPSVLFHLFVAWSILTIITLLVWAMYRTPTDTGLRNVFSRWDPEDAGKAVLGVVLGNGYFFMIWPELYKKFYETGSPFWGVNLALATSIMFLASVPHQKEKTGVLIRKLFVYPGLVILLLRIFGATLDPSEWDDTTNRTRTASATMLSTPARFERAPYLELTAGGNTVLPEVQALFPTDTVMWNICAAESNCSQFYSDGSVVTNENDDGTTDYGAFQINSIHRALADSLGFDIMTTEGNVQMAQILKDRKVEAGRDPYEDWNASRTVWEDWQRPGGTLHVATPGNSTIGTFVVIAPTNGEWSPWVETPKGFGIDYETQDEFQPYVVQERSGREHAVATNTTRIVTQSSRLRFRSAVMDSVPLLVKRYSLPR